MTKWGISVLITIGIWLSVYGFIVFLAHLPNIPDWIFLIVFGGFLFTIMTASIRNILDE